jgi:hypothetical protein
MKLVHVWACWRRLWCKCLKCMLHVLYCYRLLLVSSFVLEVVIGAWISLNPLWVGLGWVRPRPCCCGCFNAVVLFSGSRVLHGYNVYLTAMSFDEVWAAFVIADALSHLVCIFEFGHLSLLDEMMVCCLLDDWSYSPVDEISFVWLAPGDYGVINLICLPQNR